MVWVEVLLLGRQPSARDRRDPLVVLAVQLASLFGSRLMACGAQRLPAVRSMETTPGPQPLRKPADGVWSSAAASRQVDGNDAGTPASSEAG
ncbi:hypothetical protein NQZ68_008362 [Dissostichus eleginoides]|nr:hypothetical protein NQZ68_008362 [Dissostichus eleginoides]